MYLVTESLNTKLKLYMKYWSTQNHIQKYLKKKEFNKQNIRQSINICINYVVKTYSTPECKLISRNYGFNLAVGQWYLYKSSLVKESQSEKFFELKF